MTCLCSVVSDSYLLVLNNYIKSDKHMNKHLKPSSILQLLYYFFASYILQLLLSGGLTEGYSFTLAYTDHLCTGPTFPSCHCITILSKLVLTLPPLTPSPVHMTLTLIFLYLKSSSSPFQPTFLPSFLPFFLRHSPIGYTSLPLYYQS